MPVTHHVTPSNGDVLLLVGTMKGAFILGAKKSRKKWELAWPYFLGSAGSTGGMYATEDGGATWRPSNQGVRADFLPDKYPEFGQCVHKVVQSKQQPERMYLQNHWGLYRSDDCGESWKDIANGVPSDFGFAMTVHP